MDRNLSHGLVAGSAFSRSRFEESLRCKSTKSSLRFKALEASTRYEGISLRLVFLMSGSEVNEVLDTVEADLELLYEVRRESYIVRPLGTILQKEMRMYRRIGSTSHRKKIIIFHFRITFLSLQLKKTIY